MSAWQRCTLLPLHSCKTAPVTMYCTQRASRFALSVVSHKLCVLWSRHTVQGCPSCVYDAGCTEHSYVVDKKAAITLLESVLLRQDETL